MLPSNNSFNASNDFLSPGPSAPVSSVKCEICGKSLNHLSPLQRQRHLNRCLNKKESEAKLNTNVEKWGSTLDCPLCSKPLPAAGPFRVSHLKNCATKSSVSTKDVVKLVDTQKTIAAARKRKGLPHTRAPRPKKTAPISNSRDKCVPQNAAEEELQIATALSLSANASDDLCSVSFEFEPRKLAIAKDRTVLTIKSKTSKKYASSILLTESNHVLEHLQERLWAQIDAPFPLSCEVQLKPSSVAVATFIGTEQLASDDEPSSDNEMNDVNQICEENVEKKGLSLSNESSESNLAENLSPQNNSNQHEVQITLSRVAEGNPTIESIRGNSEKLSPKLIWCEKIAMEKSVPRAVSNQYSDDGLNDCTAHKESNLRQPTSPPESENDFFGESVTPEPYDPPSPILLDDICEQDSPKPNQERSSVTIPASPPQKKAQDDGIRSEELEACMSTDVLGEIPDTSNMSYPVASPINMSKIHQNNEMSWGKAPDDSSCPSPYVEHEPLSPFSSELSPAIQPTVSNKEILVPMHGSPPSQESIATETNSPSQTIPKTPIDSRHQLQSPPAEPLMETQRKEIIPVLTSLTPTGPFRVKEKSEVVIPEEPEESGELSKEPESGDEFDTAVKTPVETKPRVKVLKTLNITPTPNYKSMATPLLAAELAKNGIRKLSRRKAVQLLNQLYESTHPVVDPSDVGNMAEGSSQDEGNEKEDGGILEESCLQEDEEGNGREFIKEEVSMVVNHISRNKELYFRILTYQLVSFEEIREVVLSLDLNWSKSKIMDFLDDQHISWQFKHRPQQHRRKKWKKKL